MLTTLIIAFREFLEAFLIVGVFFGLSRKMHLKKEFEIVLAATVGIGISFALSGITYSFGDIARSILTEERAELLGSYLLLFSGVFLVYVIFSLHNKISEGKKDVIQKAKSKLENNAFDVSLFATIVFLVAREGFEIALFTASTSLFAVFLQNFLGFLIGFALAAIIGSITYLAYTKFPIKKIFRITEYMIILLGASMAQVGATHLLEYQFGLHLGDIVSFRMKFLPGEDTIFGHLLQSFAGIDAEFSLARLFIMVVYISGVYVYIRYRREQHVRK